MDALIFMTVQCHCCTGALNLAHLFKPEYSEALQPVELKYLIEYRLVHQTGQAANFFIAENDHELSCRHTVCWIYPQKEQRDLFQEEIAELELVAESDCAENLCRYDKQVTAHRNWNVMTSTVVRNQKKLKNLGQKRELLGKEKKRSWGKGLKTKWTKTGKGMADETERGDGAEYQAK